MPKNHLKTITVPVTWPIERKAQTFAMRPKPGKKFEYSMPLSLVLKNLLKYSKTTKEVKAILHENEIIIDGMKRKDISYPVGLMDVLSIPLTGEHYRMLINPHGKLEMIKISKEESTLKLCKIINKTILKGGKTQLNFIDGRNLLVKDNKYKTGDSVEMLIPGQEIKQVYSLEKGAYAYLIGGKHIGEHGMVEHISDSLVTLKTKESKFNTPEKFVFVIGKEKPAINLFEK